MFPFYNYGMFYDRSYFLVLLGAMLVMFAQIYVQSTFAKYNQTNTNRGFTGYQAARAMLDAAGLYDVKIERVGGRLTDHYDPRSMTLRLSEATYDSRSVGAVAVAAHECGHAIQHAEGYLPLRLRASFVPLVNFGSTLAVPMILFGLMLNMMRLVTFGIWAFALVLIFQLITLPVEFNASHRAIRMLSDQQVFTNDEVPGARRVLTAAALTYVASTLSTALQLLRFIMIANNRRRD